MRASTDTYMVPDLERAASVQSQLGGNFHLDDAVLEALPSGTRVISADSFGASAWSITARIDAVTEQGAPVGFFLKCLATEEGRAQVEGEYQAMSELQRTVPHLVPRPIARGRFRLASPPTYFFLIEFVQVSNRLPDPVQLGLRLAELHHKSVSPTGKFGFHITTYDGNLPHNVEWNDSWPDFFAKLLQSAYEHDERANGLWEELETLFTRVIGTVIPRLLGALEADGRRIKPCLVHGDLWEGNVGTEYNTGKIYIFDSCAYYAHNEMELGPLTVDHHRLRAKVYKREYLRHFEASEPVNEWDDRIRLYSLKELFINSALFPGSQVRARAYETLNYLVRKFPSPHVVELQKSPAWDVKSASNATVELFTPEHGHQQSDLELLDLDAQADEESLNKRNDQPFQETPCLDSDSTQLSVVKQTEAGYIIPKEDIAKRPSDDGDAAHIAGTMQSLDMVEDDPCIEAVVVRQAEVKVLSMTYSNADSEESALKLVHSVSPAWESNPGTVEVVRFTDGIMNTLLKLTKKVPGRPDSVNEEEAVLLRAYGKDSDILVDRDMEAVTHALLAARGLAAPLLARFHNGLLYGYTPGRVCTPQDLQKETVWRAVAARLGEWHARLPFPLLDAVESQDELAATNASNDQGITGRSQSANIWSVIRKWISALPTRNETEEAQKTVLQEEVEKSFGELNHDRGLGHHGLVLGHCDLLTANIILPLEEDTPSHDSDGVTQVKTLKERIRFIDYEYAVPCPAAFDLANHFAEWGGFECDYNLLPTKAVRRAFIQEYAESYSRYASLPNTISSSVVDDLLADTDQYRGIPGLYWGVQALIQDAISDVDFDWVSYGAVRLAEYWAWRAEVDSSRINEGKEMPLRERRWALSE